MVQLNKIYNEDCLTGLKKIDDNSIDMILTSPPYDDLRHYNNLNTEWNYNIFLLIAKELVRVLSEGGIMVWVVNDKTEKGSKTGTSFRQALSFIELGLNLNDTMIWRKTNPMPQVKQPRYTSCFEYMFVFSKGKPKTFNPIMRPCKCSGQDYDSTCKNMGGENGRTKKHFKINKETTEYNIWDIAVAQNKTKHPAVFPYELAYKHILSWSNEGDIVLDPFMGSGTTAIACINTNRNYIGFELNNEYVEISNKRIEGNKNG